MDKPLVSVIVLTYKHEKYIKQCLDSIINQSYKNIELILINDGSPDNTDVIVQECIKKLEKRFINVIYVNKSNEGIVKSFNKGLDLSQGEYIVPFASDDVMFPERIELQVEYLEARKDYGLVYTDGFHVDTEGILDINAKYDEKKQFSTIMSFQSGDLFDFMLKNLFRMPTPTICIRRECYNVVGKYDENLLCEDPDMFIRISRKFKIGFVNQPLVLHRIHVNNSGRNPNIIEPSVMEMIRKYKNDDSLTVQQKEILLETLYRAAGITNLDKIKKVVVGKKIIGWGTGSFYQKCKHQFNVEYLVDSDKEKTGKFLDNKEIFLPDHLLFENKEEIFVIVFSIFQEEIYKWLKNNNFEYFKNYY